MATPENRCPICGGTAEEHGANFECLYCGHKWRRANEFASESLRMATAYEKLRTSAFDEAEECFAGILASDAHNYEAHWGRALARHGIIFVDDLQEGKKVPTCNAITEDSFLSDADVQAALRDAPADLAENYRAMAEKIEKIRAEWLETARREPPYDVFICYKESDRENGVSRTEDSAFAEELYTSLIEAGYRVFFARRSLQGKVAEHYEPYIYNALCTAQVMIVLGSRAEYFASVWMKNEWSRFITRVKNKEKHPAGLVVVTRGGLSASDLPAPLRARQCLNGDEMQFFGHLQDHIARVLAEMKGQVKLEKIRVDGGQISRKATKIAQESIRTREIGAAESTADLDEKQQIDLAYSYLQARDFARAGKQIDDVLFHDPACAEAYLCRILLNRKLGSLEDLAGQIGQFADYDLLQAYLDRADKDGATRILDLFYGAQASMSDDTYAKVLQVILPYQYANRDGQIADNLEGAIEAGHAASFDLLLKTLDPSEVERYITLNLRHGDRLRKADRYTQAQIYYDRVLAVDEGNSDALRGTVYVKLCLDEDPAVVTAVWERLLRYLPADKVGDEVQSMVKWMGGLRASSQRCGFGKNLLKYYPGEDMRPLTAPLLKMADSWIEDGYPAEAEYIVQLILAADKSCAGAWRALCLIRMGVKKMEDVKTCETSISSCCEAEFNQFLALVDKDERAHYIKLQHEQEEYICNVRRKVAALLTGDVREMAALRPYFASLDRQDVCRELDARAAVVQKRYEQLKEEMKKCTPRKHVYPLWRAVIATWAMLLFYTYAWWNSGWNVSAYPELFICLGVLGGACLLLTVIGQIGTAMSEKNSAGEERFCWSGNAWAAILGVSIVFWLSYPVIFIWATVEHLIIIPRNARRYKELEEELQELIANTHLTVSDEVNVKR